jgi:hypothetical protein
MYAIAVALLTYGTTDLDLAADTALKLAALEDACARLAANAEWSTLVSELVVIGAA